MNNQNINEYHQDNLHIYNMDCIELMKQYHDKYFDLAIVDPPYGIGINVSIGRRKGMKKSNYHKFAGNDLKIPSKIYFQELKRVSKNQIIWGGNYMTQYLDPSPCWLLYDKDFSEDLTFAQFELAWTSFSKTTKKFTMAAQKQTNRIHPTQKPVALYKWILEKYSKPEYKILDTHLGSGTAAIANHYFNTNEFVACELDEDYYKASIDYIYKNTRQLSLMDLLAN